MTGLTFARTMDNAAKTMAVFAAVALLLPAAWVNISLALFLLFWMAGGNWREKLARVRANALTPWVLALFALFAVGLTYTSASRELALEIFGKYAKLLYIPLLFSVFYESAWQRRAYYAFLAVMIVMLLLSYGQLLGWVPLGPPGQDYTLFKGRIAFGLFLAFTAYLLVHHLRTQPRLRWLWALLLGLALYNLLFMNEGRTGYAAFFGLLLLFACQLWRWRGLVIAVVAAALLGGGAFLASPVFKARVVEVADNIQQFEVGEADTSVGLRLQFYQNTLRLIATHPFLGGGTGSFIPEYAQLAEVQHVRPTDNPHNEYLLVTTQLGLAGLALLLALGYKLWVHSRRLAAHYRHAAQGLLVTMGVGSLFNSMLMDFSEGHFFVYFCALLYAGLARPAALPDLAVPTPEPGRVARGAHS